MRRLLATTCAVLAVASASRFAAAAETPYSVTVDGRPLDAKHPGARDRDGFLFVNLVRSVRAFDGLLTFAPNGARVTVGAHTIVYHTGQTGAETDDGKSITLPAAPFMEDGDLYVPVISFATIANARVTVDKDTHALDLSVPKAGAAPSPTP